MLRPRVLVTGGGLFHLRRPQHGNGRLRLPSPEAIMPRLTDAAIAAFAASRAAHQQAVCAHPAAAAVTIPGPSSTYRARALCAQRHQVQQLALALRSAVQCSIMLCLISLSILPLWAHKSPCQVPLFHGGFRCQHSFIAPRATARGLTSSTEALFAIPSPAQDFTIRVHDASAAVTSPCAPCRHRRTANQAEKFDACAGGTPHFSMHAFAQAMRPAQQSVSCSSSPSMQPYPVDERAESTCTRDKLLLHSATLSTSPILVCAPLTPHFQFVTRINACPTPH